MSKHYLRDLALLSQTPEKGCLRTPPSRTADKPPALDGALRALRSTDLLKDLPAWDYHSARRATLDMPVQRIVQRPRADGVRLQGDDVRQLRKTMHLRAKLMHAHLAERGSAKVA